jgi:head-tail adaptor
MTHPNQIAVYRYEKANDGFGGFVPATPTLMADAPTWATIQETSGDDLILSERYTTQRRFDIKVNWRDDFTWSRGMFIVSDEYGIIDIDGIQETKRKRHIDISGVYVEGVDDTGSGTPATVNGLTTLYYSVPADASTLSLPVLDEKTLYLLFRDGIEKKIVASNPQINEVAVNGTTLSLVDGDIFVVGERITILYL